MDLQLVRSATLRIAMAGPHLLLDHGRPLACQPEDGRSRAAAGSPTRARCTAASTGPASASREPAVDAAGVGERVVIAADDETLRR